MFYAMTQQYDQYSRGISAADQRAVNDRLGEGAAALRDLRQGLRRAFRARIARTAAPVVTATTTSGLRPATPARVLAGVR
jgi:hypothetical protein